MNSFKPGLVSKNYEVAKWAAMLLSKISYLIVNNKQKKLLQISWQWFISKYGGLHSCILSLRRHNYIRDKILEIMLHFGINSFYELFTSVLKNESTNPKEFLLTITDLFVPMISNEVSL